MAKANFFIRITFEYCCLQSLCFNKIGGGSRKNIPVTYRYANPNEFVYSTLVQYL